MWILLLVVCSPLALGQQVNVDGLLTTTGEETIVYEQETLPKATSWTPEEPGFTFATDTSYYAPTQYSAGGNYGFNGGVGAYGFNGGVGANAGFGLGDIVPTALSVLFGVFALSFVLSLLAAVIQSDLVQDLFTTETAKGGRSLDFEKVTEVTKAIMDAYQKFH